ncbi:MAG TPA: HAD hydrolase-like protein [Segetibacter sp.]|jgi:3-deoxy-D-manno-octulosonate 8-phosphate phosphatase (KDO 8-P phosphatase)
MNLLTLFKSVTTFAFDVDGVLTDGTLTVLPGGVMARKMNVKDGYALQLAVKKGYKIVIISGGASEEVTDRMNKLGVAEVYMRVTDKVTVLNNFLERHQLSWQEVLYMGDDIPDTHAMKKVGMACCPLDAVSEVKDISAYISPINGGFGCARDVIEKVLKMRGDWNDDPYIASK